MRGYVATSQPAQTTVKKCTSCGATAEFPAGSISASCSYCTAPLVDGERGEMAVDRVAPFRITRSVAQQRLQEHLSGRFWAPSAIRRGVLQDHRLRGVLVPFFAYTGVARSQYAAQVGMYYYRTETYRDSNGKTRTRTKRETEWFSHQGSAVGRLQDHLVSASKGLPEQESNDLEPFDLGHALAFDRGLLAGWEAELPNIDFARADHTARQEVSGLESARISRRLLPGDTGKVSNVNTNITMEKRDVVLLPIWMASFRHGPKVYRQLVNGQTGQVIGDTPVSAGKIALACLAATVIATILWLGMAQL